MKQSSDAKTSSVKDETPTNSTHIYKKRSLIDWQYEVHIHPHNWEGQDDIECRTNVFLEVLAKLYNKTNVYGHPIAFVDVPEIDEEESRIPDHLRYKRYICIRFVLRVTDMP